MKPMAIDLFCGLGGWSEGLLAEGWDVVGFDIERHAYGDAKYPAQLVIQDVLTIHGSQFKGASLIVASPPCQEFSYMAMPWTRAKDKARKLREDAEDRKRLTAMFDACFRIQREAIAAAGHHIPMVVENVRGAQPWVGRARTHFGSFYLWGDVPALMPLVKRATKNKGGSWFAIAHNTTSGHSKNPVHELMGQKLPGNNVPRLWQERRVKRLADAQRHDSDAFYFASSGSNARKAASAAIAKIPFVLARHIAAYYKPEAQESAA